MENAIYFRLLKLVLNKELELYFSLTILNNHDILEAIKTISESGVKGFRFENVLLLLLCIFSSCHFRQEIVDLKISYF